MSKPIPHPRMFPHRERFVIEVAGDFAMFCQTSAALNRVTYQIPTPSALRGMLKGVYHSNALFPIPLRVEFLSPPRTVSVPQTMIRNSVIGYSRAIPADKTQRAPQGALYIQKPAYRITYEVRAMEAKKIRTLRRRLETGASENPPYLGTRECGVDITLPTDRPIQDDVYLIEPKMFVGNVYGMVEVRKGVVEYPEWTIEALFTLRDQRMEGHHAVL